jgi:hypothetical protein
VRAADEMPGGVLEIEAFCHKPSLASGLVGGPQADSEINVYA